MDGKTGRRRNIFFLGKKVVDDIIPDAKANTHTHTHTHTQTHRTTQQNKTKERNEREQDERESTYLTHFASNTKKVRSKSE